jgi:hypothetical protein
MTGFITRCQGIFEEGVRGLERSRAGSAQSLYRAADRAPVPVSARYAESAAMWDHALAIKPDDADTKVARAFLELDWKAATRPLIPQPVETATLLGPAPPRSAVRKNRHLTRGEKKWFAK